MTAPSDSDISLKLDLQKSNRISATAVIAGIAASGLLALLGFGISYRSFFAGTCRGNQ